MYHLTVWWIMIENHADWMSDPQSTLKNHVSFSTHTQVYPPLQ